MIEVTLKVQCDGCAKRDETEYKAERLSLIHRAEDERLEQLMRERWKIYGPMKLCPACRTAREMTARSV